MQRPKDPRKHMAEPKSHLKNNRFARVKGKCTLGLVKELIAQIPTEVAESEVEISIDKPYYASQADSTITANWIVYTPNPKYDEQKAAYDAELKAFEENSKKFVDYMERKARGEKEALADEVARLKERLAFKEAELARKNAE